MDNDLDHSSKRMMHSRWAAQIIGHHHDLSNMLSKLNNSIVSVNDIFMSIIGTSYCLRCKEWDAIDDQAMLKAVINNDLATVRGCLDCLDGSAILKVGTIFELDIDQNILKRTRDFEMNTVVLPMVGDRASPMDLRRMLHLSRKNEYLKTAVTDLDAFAGWYSIYKSVEACLGVWGGLSVYKKHDGTDGALIDRVKQTANWYRHASITYPYPKNPVDLDEARSATKKLIRATAEYLGTECGDMGIVDQTHTIPPNKFSGQRMSLPRHGFGDGAGFNVGVVGEDVDQVMITLPGD